MNKGKIGIVILNYNTYQLTLDLIRNINNVIEGFDYFIVVVDNASINESNSILSKNAEILGYEYIYIVRLMEDMHKVIILVLYAQSNLEQNIY